MELTLIFLQGGVETIVKEEGIRWLLVMTIQLVFPDPSLLVLGPVSSFKFFLI